MSIPKFICLPAPFATLPPESTPYEFQTANLAQKKLANSKNTSQIGLPLTHSNLNKDYKSSSFLNQISKKNQFPIQEAQLSFHGRENGESEQDEANGLGNSENQYQTPKRDVPYQVPNFQISHKNYESYQYNQLVRNEDPQDQKFNLPNQTTINSRNNLDGSKPQQPLAQTKMSRSQQYFDQKQLLFPPNNQQDREIKNNKPFNQQKPKLTEYDSQLSSKDEYDSDKQQQKKINKADPVIEGYNKWNDVPNKNNPQKNYSELYQSGQIKPPSNQKQQTIFGASHNDLGERSYTIQPQKTSSEKHMPIATQYQPRQLEIGDQSVEDDLLANQDGKDKGRSKQKDKDKDKIVLNLVKQLEDLREQLKERDSEIEDLKSHSNKTAKKGVELRTLQMQIDDLKQLLQEKDEIIDELTQKLQTNRSKQLSHRNSNSNEIQELNQKLLEKQQDFNFVTEKLQSLSQMYEQEINNMQSREEELQNYLNEKDLQIQQFNDDQGEQINYLSQKIEEGQKLLYERENILIEVECKNQNSLLKKQLQDVFEQLSELGMLEQKFEKVVQQLNRDNQNLSEQSLGLGNDLNQLREQNVILSNELEKHKELISFQKQMMEKLQEDIARKQELINQLEGNVFTQHLHTENLKNQNDFQPITQFLVQNNAIEVDLKELNDLSEQKKLQLLNVYRVFEKMKDTFEDE